ncbi:MAG: DNA phosphorothioation system sulfurtransferase DndC [Nitrospirae bacterium]|nr:DNA phosphorothioation system sulfurtransferase DndC [Nitrospirota bacterium]
MMKTSELIEKTRAYLIKNYFSDSRPWVVAFSGGKDSTLVLQLVYEMVMDNKVKAFKPVYVIMSDTCVEPPNIAYYIESTLDRIKSHAGKEGLPFNVEVVTPAVEERFWAKLIGKGYPSPTRWFRWCTSNMKIRPSRRAIKKVTDKYGSVLLLFGTRLDESTQRRHRMEGRLYNERGLNPHDDIPNALIATPIADWSSDEVWEYLFNNNPPPWGGSHDTMLDLYKKASGGECPIVLNLNTPSCGGSRFGCWVCTVVKEDKSMQGFIDTGEEWLRPLNKFRNWLKEIREDTSMRMGVRRNKSTGPGPFTPETRQKILEQLLITEMEMNAQLISDEEIAYIQRVWSEDFDLSYSAYRISGTYGREIKNMRLPTTLSSKEQEILDGLLSEFEVQPDLIEKLLRLVTEDYPTLDFYGAKAALERDIKDAIEFDVVRDEMAESHSSKEAVENEAVEAK